MNTIEVLQEIYSNIPEINEVLFHYFPKQILLQDRINFGAIENIQYKEAMAIRSKYKLPFWDSIMLTYFGREIVSNKILESALDHNKAMDEFWIKNLYQLNDFSHEDFPSRNVALNSKVKLINGQIKHLPLLDFHIPIGLTNVKIVIKVLKHLGFTSGYILESGESYHFIGDYLIGDEELLNLLSRSLLFSPIIDRAWIAHQLLEKSSSLRIGYKHNILPHLIHKLNHD
jgi:hypothetical protein